MSNSIALLDSFGNSPKQGLFLVGVYCFGTVCAIIKKMKL